MYYRLLSVIDDHRRSQGVHGVQMHPQSDQKKFFYACWNGGEFGEVRCAPLGEIKLSKLSVICIYKHEKRVTTKKGHQIF